MSQDVKAHTLIECAGMCCTRIEGAQMRVTGGCSKILVILYQATQLLTHKTVIFTVSHLETLPACCWCQETHWLFLLGTSE
jgi:hypothetical protein